MNRFFALYAVALVVLLAQETLQSRTKIRRSVSQSNRKYQCGARKRQVEGLITNGSNTKVGEWPWHGALFHRKNRRSREYKCGATLIHQNFVITASHCVVDRDSGYEVSARYVTVDFGYVQLFRPSSYGQSHAVQEIFVHPKFAKDSNKHDVAILSLKTAVIFSDYVLPICLQLTRSDTNIHDIVGKQGVVVGWGLTEDDETSTDLKLANVPVVDYAECLETDPDLFGSLIYPGMFCAGSRDGTSVCNGDSGGGMYFNNGRRWILRGITSFSDAREDGSNKCDVNNYAGFVNVQYYASWIFQTVQGVDVQDAAELLDATENTRSMIVNVFLNALQHNCLNISSSRMSTSTTLRRLCA
ncbi:vitamin K-dependent protein C-like [Aedes albopictus]|uniref:Peptidase S1 domain-containing protein n=1 Tax=Aedes albopictus TaxID=7160 RepID=A0ABM1Z5G0_AEDAL|nr:vitamin K-dependent protein C-like [Aedes albopictus]